MDKEKAMSCKPGETVREHYAHGGKFDDFPVADAPSGDEDLITPKHVLHLNLPRLSLEQAGALAGRIMADTVSNPELRAGFCGAVLLPLLVGHSRRIPFVPLLILSLMGEAAGIMVWRSYKNLEVIAQAARDA